MTDEFGWSLYLNNFIMNVINMFFLMCISKLLFFDWSLFDCILILRNSIISLIDFSIKFKNCYIEMQ